ncbi:MAG TPA: hypothetical protein HPP77_01690 [Candidatus Hydrogenedentes bacterium]|nr:hypothetical protein [Candidatus Hydrogenedentota bacterium]
MFRVKGVLHKGLMLALTFLVGCRTLSDVAALPVFLPIILVSLPFLPVGLTARLLEDRNGITSAQFMPDGDGFLVTYRDGACQHIYCVAKDGAFSTALTQGRRFDFEPVYSPDGKQILFSSAVGGHTRLKGNIKLFLMNADGSDLRQLTEGPSQDVCARFSPNGKQVVFASSRDKHQADLFLINADGTGKNQLTSGKDNDASPALLSDGRNVLFQRGRWYGHYSPIAASAWHDFDLYRVSVDGEEPQRLTRECLYEASDLEIAPASGRGLLNRRLFSLDNPEVFTECHPKGSKYTLMNENGHNLRDFSQPRFSPDGGYIVFTMWHDTDSGDDACGLHLVDIETGEAREIARMEGEILDPRFSPNGKEIVFLASRDRYADRPKYELRVVGVDGSELRIIEFEVNSNNQ